MDAAPVSDARPVAPGQPSAADSGSRDPEDGGQRITAASADAQPANGRVACPRDDDSLRLCLRFEGGLVDESGAGRSVDGDQVSFESSAPGSGRAARLGPGTSIRVPESGGLDLQSFTIEAWINLERLPAAGGRVGVVDKEARYGMFVLPNGALVCSARGAVAMAPAGSVQAGQWFAVACTATATAVNAWVAGARRAEAAAAATEAPQLPGLAIGSNMPSGDPLIGSLDNLRIWSRVLGAGEICAAAWGCP